MEIEYVPCTTIKGQVLANFLVEISIEGPPNNEEVRWTLHMDGSSKKMGVVLQGDPFTLCIIAFIQNIKQ